MRRQTLILKEMTKKMKENLEAETNRFYKGIITIEEKRTSVYIDLISKYNMDKLRFISKGQFERVSGWKPQG